MKQIKILVAVLFLAGMTHAQYKPVDKSSTIKFSIKNFGINTGGSFGGLDGSIMYDATDPGKTSFNVTIDANSINTDNEMRDNHLRKEDYFDVKKYPRISFMSAKVSTTDKTGVLMVTGKLTIKNQSKDISFPFTVTQEGSGLMFKGSFTINRKDFGVGGTSVISNSLEVQLNVLATK